MGNEEITGETERGNDPSKKSHLPDASFLELKITSDRYHYSRRISTRFEHTQKTRLSFIKEMGKGGKVPQWLQIELHVRRDNP